MIEYTEEQLQFIKDLKLEGEAWELIAELFTEKFDIKKSAEAMRKTFKRYNLGEQVINDDTLFDTMKQGYRNKVNNTRLRKKERILLDKTVTKEDTLTELEQILKRNPVRMNKYNPPKFKKSKPTRSIVANLSDLHFGTRISKGEVDGVNEYNHTVAARRLALYMREIVNYKPHHRQSTELVLVINGDVLGGIIHSQENGVDLITEQMAMAMSYLAQGISFLANNFKKVTVISTSDNHSRMMHKQNKGRQSTQKWDQFQTILMISIEREIKRAYKNVKFKISESPITNFETQGFSYACSHGDTSLSTANPAKSINTKSIIDKINSLNIERMSNNKKKVSVVLLAHHHSPANFLMNDGTHVMINGCMSGIDSYAHSLDIFSNNPSQTLFEATSEYPVGDMRIVQLKKADEDESLDRIIVPFQGVFEDNK